MRYPSRFVSLAVLSMSVVLLGGCGIFGGEKNTRPPAQLQPIKTSLVVKQLWSVQVGNGNGGYFLHLHPYVANGTVYAADHDGMVAAYSAKNGRQLWSVETGHKLVGGVSGGDGLIYVGGQDGALIGISLKQHAVAWKTQLSSGVISLSEAHQGEIVVHANDGKLYALDVATGNVVWTYSSQAPNLILRGKSRPIISGNDVVAGFSNGKLAAFSLSSGTQLWQLTVGSPRGASALDRLVDIDGRVAVSDGMVYAASYNGRAVAAQLDGGQLLWAHRISSYAGLALNSNAVFVTGADSDIWALDRNDGASLWKQDALHFREVTAPAVVGQYVVVGDYAGYLQWLSVKDGSLVAREQVDSDGIQAEPVVVGDTVFVQGVGGTLAAYQAVGPTDKVKASSSANSFDFQF